MVQLKILQNTEWYILNNIYFFYFSYYFRWNFIFIFFRNNYL